MNLFCYGSLNHKNASPNLTRNSVVFKVYVEIEILNVTYIIDLNFI